MAQSDWKMIGTVQDMQNASRNLKAAEPQYTIGAVPRPPVYDSWPELLAKSAGKGFTALADIPKFAGNLAEGAVNLGRRFQGFESVPGHEGLGNVIRFKTNPNAPQTNYSDYIPDTEDARRALNKYTGIDLEPHPSPEQYIASQGAEFAGGLANPAFWLTKGAALGKNAMNLAKAAGTGAAIGTTSGVLQESGVNPLVADIGTSVAFPAAGAGARNLLNKFSPSHKNLVTEKKLTNALKARIGEDNVDNVLKNIDQYKRQKLPIKLSPTTPEIAQDVGLSQLYRTQSDLGAIPARYKENDVKLKSALSDLGTTGLEESVKGETLRQPFIKKFAKAKQQRSDLVEPLYKALEDIKTGINPKAAKELLKKELSVASPGNQAALNKYLKGLTRNEISDEKLNKIKTLKAEIKNIDTEHKDLNPLVVKLLKQPLMKELAEAESLLHPLPLQLENTIQELGDKVNALSRTGESNAARRFGAIKKAYEQDLSQNPVGLKHRAAYALLSKPINEIETSSLLNAFVKENKDVNKLAGLVAPSEKIPELVLKADLPNTKILMNATKSRPESIKLIKGIYIDELLKNSTLSSGNFSFDKANKFLNNKFMKEKVNVIFDANEKKILKQFLDTLEKRTKVETMGKVSGSDTHQKLKIDEAFNNSLSGLGKLLGHSALKATGTGHAGEAIFNTSKDYIKNMTNRRYNNALEKALIEPEYFKKLVTNETSPKTFKDFYNPKSSVNPAKAALLLNLKEKDGL